MDPLQAKHVRFTADEKQILLALVEKHKKVIENKKTNTVSILAKQKSWMAIEREYNSQANVTRRTLKQLMKCWDNYKVRYKKDRAERRKEVFLTGGGVSSQTPMDPFLDLVGSIAPHIDHRDENEYDCDAVEVIIDQLPDTDESHYQASPSLLDNNNALSPTECEDVQLELEPVYVYSENNVSISFTDVETESQVSGRNNQRLMSEANTRSESSTSTNSTPNTAHSTANRANSTPSRSVENPVTPEIQNKNS